MRIGTNANSFFKRSFRRHRLRGIFNSLVRAVSEPINRVHTMKNIFTVEKISVRRGLLFDIRRAFLHGREEPQLISRMVTTTIKQDQIKGQLSGKFPVF